MEKFKYCIDKGSVSKAALFSFALLSSLFLKAQQFSIRAGDTETSLFQNVIVSTNDFMTIGTGYDSLNNEVIRPLFVRGYDQQGALSYDKRYHSSEWVISPVFDANARLNDTTLIVACEKYIAGNPETFLCLVWLDNEGDTLQTKVYSSPSYNANQEDSNYNRPTALTTSPDGQYIYYVAQIAEVQPLQNNFIIRKLSAQGEIIWTYVNPVDYWYYSCNSLCYYLGQVWFTNIASGNLGNYNKLQRLNDLTGTLDFDIEHQAESYPIGGSADMIINQEGVVITATKLQNGEPIPHIYQMDYEGNYVWYQKPSNTGAYNQHGKHVARSDLDGGYVSCSVKYDRVPSIEEPNDPGEDNSNERIWLWKVDQEGELVWQRFYEWFSFDCTSYHRLYNWCHDMKATPDGGVIMAGEASASCANYPICDEFTQQGWLLKVDACGCLVPGCDPNCVVSVEETQAEDEKNYFRFGPNPVRDVLNIFVPTLPAPMHEFTFSIFDAQGRRINDFQLQHDNTTYIIDTQSLASANYFLTLTHNGQIVQSEKLVKE